MRHGRDLVVLKQPRKPRYRDRIPALAGEHERTAAVAELPARRISTARPHSGTRCSRFAFIRSPTRRPAAISAHRAPRTSPDRADVSTRNSNASLTAVVAPEAHTVRIAAATSAWGNARMCCTRSCWGPSTGPRRSHGLSVRNSNAMAQSITELMRWRTRRAVAGRTCQMRRSVSSTSALVTSHTGILPMCGRTYRVRLDIQS